VDTKTRGRRVVVWRRRSSGTWRRVSQ